MSFNTQNLIDHFDEIISSSSGDDCSFSNISGYEFAKSDSLVFLQNSEQFQQITSVQPAVIVCEDNTANELRDKFKGKLICTTNVKLAQAKIKQHFDDYQSEDFEWGSIHSSAIIHESATIGEDCRIGPGVVIGENCTLGDNVIVRSNSVIEKNVTIGAGCIINSLVNIGYACELGERVTIQSGCIIGNEGYGFATDNKNTHFRIPHTGNVLISDDVHIGSNTCVDRGTYGSTRIERGVKIDNLCHIAHNVNIDEDCLITAQTVIAGSSKIGKRVIASGQTGVLDHTSIADDVILVHRAGVTKDITKAGVWAGTPPQPIKEYVKNLALGRKVSRLEQKLKNLSDQLLNKG